MPTFREETKKNITGLKQKQNKEKPELYKIDLNHIPPLIEPRLFDPYRIRVKNSKQQHSNWYCDENTDTGLYKKVESCFSNMYDSVYFRRSNVTRSNMMKMENRDNR
eukprot:UN19583